MRAGTGLIAIGLLLAACTADRPAQPVAVSNLRCDNGQMVRIAWWPEKAEVTFREDRWTLPLAMSGSGARYADGLREVWEHQGIVRVTDGTAPPTSCR